MNAERIDALIDRMLDLEIRAVDLEELSEIVRADGGARFDRAVDAERALRRGMTMAEQAAASVQIRPDPDRGDAAWPDRWRGTAAMWASWALTAASVAVAASLAVGSAGRAESEADGPRLSVHQEETPARHVLRELPLVPVAMRRGDSGAVEVVYVRPSLERAEVSGVYRFARDEHGRAVAVRAESTQVDREAM